MEMAMAAGGQQGNPLAPVREVHEVRKRMINMEMPKSPSNGKWVIVTIVLAAIVVGWLALSGCAVLEPLDGSVDFLESTRSSSGDIDPRVAAVKEVLEVVRDDVRSISGIVSSEASGLSKIFDIGSLFSGPLVSIAGALLGFGGIAGALRKRKDLRSLASVLVRVAGDDGQINTKDELTKARLAAMSPGATAAIREAQGKS